MIIVNYVVSGHEPEITFRDGFIELLVEEPDVVSVIRGRGDKIGSETVVKKRFVGRLMVASDLDKTYQLNLTKR